MPTARLTGQARRAAILDAAVQLFSEKGFRGVTTRELAAAVGVSEPVLYQHFETKRDLYRAIIEEKASVGDRKILDDLCCAFDPTEGDRKFLIRLANGIINWYTSDPAYVRLLMFSALDHHELNQMFVERYSSAFFGMLSKFFAQRISEGAFRERDPMLAAHTFTGMAANYALNRVLFGESPLDMPQLQIVEGFVDIFLEGIRER